MAGECGGPARVFAGLVAVAEDPFEGLCEFGEVAHLASWSTKCRDVGGGVDGFVVAVGDGGAALGHEFGGDVVAVVFVVQGEALVAAGDGDTVKVELLAEVDEEPDVVPCDDVCAQACSRTLGVP